MARFTEIVGQPPRGILRALRMRRAVEQLNIGQLSIDQIVRNAGYESRSSFGANSEKHMVTIPRNIVR